MSEINYSFIRTTSKLDGTPFEEILTLYDAKVSRKFGSQLGGRSTDGKTVLVDCSCPDLWQQRVDIEPRLAELTYAEEDKPTYLPTGCQDQTPSDVKNVTSQNASTKDSSDGYYWMDPEDLPSG